MGVSEGGCPSSWTSGSGARVSTATVRADVLGGGYCEEAVSKVNWELVKVA